MDGDEEIQNRTPGPILDMRIFDELRVCLRESQLNPFNYNYYSQQVRLTEFTQNTANFISSHCFFKPIRRLDPLIQVLWSLLVRKSV